MGKITNMLRECFGMDASMVQHRLTNQRVLNEIQEHFREQICYKSAGKTMIFPMTFILCVHPADYEELKNDFPIYFPDIVNGFYEIIRENRKKYPVIGAHANDWNAYIYQCLDKNVVLNGQDVAVKKGDLLIFSSLFDTVEKNPGGTGQMTNMSVYLKGTVCMNDININRAMFSGVEMVGEGHYRIKWQNPFALASEDSMVSVHPVPSLVSNPVLGVLKCTFVDGSQSSYEIRDKVCQVSGAKDARKDLSIFKLPSSVVGCPHVEIMYMKENNSFGIAAYYPTKLDDVYLPVSKQGNPQWTLLKQNARIMLTKKITLVFTQTV